MNALLIRLREVLNYEPSTGELTWKASTNRRIRVGVLAGTRSRDSYIYISIDGERYMAHRIVWLFEHGDFPQGFIDHRDGNKHHNQIANLRDVTQTVNMQNQRRPKSNNTSGFLGVFRSRTGKRWSAAISTSGPPAIRKHLGTFSTPEEAHLAYVEAKRALHKGNTL